MNLHKDQTSGSLCKILVATPYLRYEKAGGSVFPRLLAGGLIQAGHDTILMGLDNKDREDVNNGIRQIWIKDPVEYGWGRYPLFDGFLPNEKFKQSCRQVIEKLKPDVIIVNSLNRLGDLIEEAKRFHIPILYIACDLGASCMNEIGLYEESDGRCNGPAIEKCINCQTSQFSWIRFCGSRLMKLLFKVGVI